MFIVTVLVVMIFILVKLEAVVCQPTTTTENSTSGCDLHELQQGQLQMLLQMFQQFQQNVGNQLQSVQQQICEQSKLIEQLQNQTRETCSNCGCEPTVRYYDLQFQTTPLLYGRSRDQLVCELRTICNPLLIQQNVDGSNFFNRTWEEFKVGFSGSNGNYWLGNELLHQLTMNNTYKLRFDLQSRDNNSQWFWAEYNTFTVGSETTNYTLHVGGFSGNVYSDAFSYQNGTKFTTRDRDNDMWGGNCAQYNGGGYWYKACAWCNVNTVWGHGDSYRWYNWLTLTPSYSYLQTSRMWLVCR